MMKNMHKHTESVRGKLEVIVDDFFILKVRAGTSLIMRVGDDYISALEV
jgi:hypothetical protein